MLNRRVAIVRGEAPINKISRTQSQTSSLSPSPSLPISDNVHHVVGLLVVRQRIFPFFTYLKNCGPLKIISHMVMVMAICHTMQSFSACFLDAKFLVPIHKSAGVAWYCKITSVRF